MKNLLALALLLLGLFSLANAQSDDWVTVTSKDGNFSVLVPAQPGFESKPGELNAQDAKTGAVLSKKVRFTANIYTSIGTGEAYLAGWADYEPGFVFNVQGELAANRDNFVKGVNATLISERKISYAGNPGLEFVAKSTSMNIKARVYIFGKRPYILVAMDGDPSFPNADKFFSSFNYMKHR